MGREVNIRSTEGAQLAELDGVIDNLSHELSCLIDLEVLTVEEEAAFSGALGHLRAILIRTRNPEEPVARDQQQASMCRSELYRMVRMLSADLDLAYQRLGFAG